MLKRILSWGALVLAVCLLLGAATLSSSYRDCDANRQKTYAQKNKPDFLEKSGTFIVCEGVSGDANGELLTALATIAVAAFTLTLWLTSKEQGRLAQQSIELASAEFNAGHRPEIVVHSVEVKNFPIAKGGSPDGAAEYLGATVTFYNKGSTEAVIEQISSRIYSQWPPLSTDLIPPPLTNVALPKTIASGIGDCFDVGSDKVASGDGLQANNPEIFCVGRIWYADMRGAHRQTGFIRRFDGQRWVHVEGSSYEYAY